ncbi:MAG: DUF6790 family protein [Alphaproteobacteria bacterium]
MSGALLRFVLVNFPLLVFAVGLVGGAIGARRAFTRTEAADAWLGPMLCAAGAAGIWIGLVHLVAGPFAARLVGWAPSPFQVEAGAGHLAVGVVAVVAASRDFGFRAAAALGAAALFGISALAPIVGLAPPRLYGGFDAALSLIAPLGTALILPALVALRASSARREAAPPPDGIEILPPDRG